MRVSRYRKHKTAGRAALSMKVELVADLRLALVRSFQDPAVAILGVFLQILEHKSEWFTSGDWLRRRCLPLVLAFNFIIDVPLSLSVAQHSHFDRAVGWAAQDQVERMAGMLLAAGGFS